jgi:serine/threonine protein kinase
VKQLDSIGFDLLQKTLIYDPALRITAQDALDHAWFTDLDKSILPTNVPA